MALIGLRGGARQLLQDRALGLVDRMDLDGELMNRGQRFVVGFRTRIVGGLNHVLADDDDRQQDELEEGLGDPGDDDDRVAGAKRGGQGDQGDRRQQGGDPHRADGLGDLHGEPGVELADRAGAVALLLAAVAENQARYVYLRLAALGTAHGSSLLIVMTWSVSFGAGGCCASSYSRHWQDGGGEGAAARYGGPRADAVEPDAFTRGGVGRGQGGGDAGGGRLACRGGDLDADRRQCRAGGLPWR